MNLLQQQHCHMCKRHVRFDKKTKACVKLPWPLLLPVPLTLLLACTFERAVERALNWQQSSCSSSSSTGSGLARSSSLSVCYLLVKP